MLAPVDRVEVTVVIDNFLDVLMAGEQGVRRYQARDFGAAEQLVAEHGFSALVSVERDGNRRTVLYDAGLTPHALARNLDVLQVPVGELRAIVISHGHADHHGGLEGLVRCRGRSRLPLVIHPDAWRERRIAFPSGGELRLPPPSRHDLEAEGLEVVEECANSLLLDGAVLVSGQVERVTEFETGFPIHEACEGDGWRPDPMIWDDQALVLNVRDRGLVIISGCSHAGVINVLFHAQRLTGRPASPACSAACISPADCSKRASHQRSRRCEPPALIASCPRTARAGRRSTRSPVPCPTPSCSPRWERP